MKRRKHQIKMTAMWSCASINVYYMLRLSLAVPIPPQSNRYSVEDGETLLWDRDRERREDERAVNH